MPTPFTTTSVVVRTVRIASQILLVAGIAAVLWPASLGGKVHYVMVSGSSMEPHMHTGDLVLVREFDAYEVGDAIAYEVPEGDVGAGNVVIHRIVGGDATSGFRTQGDNREQADTWQPTGADVLGKRQVLVPGAGNLVAELRSPLPLAVLAAAIAFVTVGFGPRREEPAVVSS